MRKYFIVVSILFLAAACGKQPATPNISTPSGKITSILIQPAYDQDGWLVYEQGAVVKVVGENLQSVEIKYWSTGTGVGEEYPNGQSLGQAISLSSLQGLWMLPLPKGPFTATNIWAEGKDLQGNIIKSEDLGNVHEDELLTYTDSKNGYSLTYSATKFDFTADKEKIGQLSYIPICPETTVGCVFYMGTDYKGTNFGAAGVSVNIDPTLNTEAKCYNFKVSTNAAQQEAGTTTINGVNFRSATGGEGATGHFIKIQIYRNFHNKRCYEIQQSFVYTNIDNYEPGTVKEFNMEEVWQLQPIVQSFEFVEKTSAKLQVCPDEWINNQMPGPAPEPGSLPKQYYILNGQRREIAEFDIVWVSKNCSIKQQTVY
jgi:hypothetical protein